MCATHSTHITFLDIAILMYHIWNNVCQQLKTWQWCKSLKYNEALLQHF
jgi:hypothetical protein